MTEPPRLCDRTALLRARARARRAPCTFLFDIVRAELQERLDEVNRTFTEPAIVTGFPDYWRGWRPDARIVPDDDVLDLQPGAQDLVVHALSLHWSPDPVGQIIQARRALRPDGLFLGVLFGGQTLSELRRVLAEAESALSGGLSPRVAPMGEIRDLGALMQRSGLALPVADLVPVNVSYPNIAGLARDLRGMGETNALAARNRRPASRALFAAAEALWRAHFPADGDRIAARFDLVFLTGWAPSDDQPRPLRPGSATHSLAEALGRPAAAETRRGGGND